MKFRKEYSKHTLSGSSREVVPHAGPKKKYQIHPNIEPSPHPPRPAAGKGVDFKSTNPAVGGAPDLE
jgi:hypothetical protein